MKVNANTLRAGHVIEHNGHLCAVIRAENIQPGKGTPVTHLEMRRIADGVRCAANNLQPARVGWGSGSEPGVVFNRRYYMKPGTMPPNPFGGIEGETALIAAMRCYVAHNLDEEIEIPEELA